MIHIFVQSQMFAFTAFGLLPLDNHRRTENYIYSRIGTFMGRGLTRKASGRGIWVRPAVSLRSSSGTAITVTNTLNDESAAARHFREAGREPMRGLTIARALLGAAPALFHASGSAGPGRGECRNPRRDFGLFGRPWCRRRKSKRRRRRQGVSARP